MAYTATFTALLTQAATQGGYFTAQQARAAGYGYDAQHYHVRQGHWDRLARGVFRLHGFPLPTEWDLIELTVQSADRTGAPRAVFSHETALALHALSDANPATLQVTVPPGFRKRLPSGVLLTHARLAEQDWEQREGYRVTTPLRTLLDIAASPHAWPFLEEAVRQALARGLVRRTQLAQAHVSTRAHARLRAALQALDREPLTRQKGTS